MSPTTARATIIIGNPAIITHKITVATISIIIKHNNKVILTPPFIKRINFHAKKKEMGIEPIASANAVCTQYTFLHNNADSFREKKEGRISPLQTGASWATNSGSPCMLLLNTIRVVNSTITFSSIK